MGKRSNGEGTIFKRNDGRWCAACYKNVAGKNKRTYVYGKSQKEVKQKLKELQQSQEDDIEEQEEVTLGDWMIEWLLIYKKATVKESTYGNYRQVVHTHIVENDIGKIPLSKLKTEDLQRFYDEKKMEITHMKRQLSPRMVNYISVLVNGALEQAVKLGKISMNPNRAVVLPKKQKYEIEPLTENEVKRLLEQAKGTKLYLPILVEVYTGMRKGELLGLCWQNVDLDKGVICVRTSLARVPIEGDVEKVSELKLLTPKTSKSVRTIPLTDRVIEELKRHKREQTVWKEANKDIWIERNLVFCKENGDFLEPRDFLADFQKLLKKAGLRKCRFHDMRHTFASMLLNEGEELKVIQELLGHTTITTTADIYAHLKTEKKLQAVCKIGEALE